MSLLLSVKTRGNVSPHGKMRIFFSSHKDDFSIYFDQICNEIFESQNCAIYYKNDGAEDKPDELYGLLIDMQVFVIPITSNYLISESCFARDYEYGFAIENHIPIIPIAMETNLYRLFSDTMNNIKKGYGDVNYINRASNDFTKIPYKEKLKSKLDSILIGDDLSARIRASFDAYIFLSYRKKDREHARDLMELIHRIPYCRDIAIWYDEYLVSGEKWRPAIIDAMKKSQLITLAVTPSLIEPDNYIAKHEYPDAIKLGKKIIPVMLMPTNYQELVKLYNGIGELIDGKNQEELENIMKEVATQKNRDIPEHNYLIGLAYLNGIDVEKNYGRAIEMITYAANQGLPEAIKKMVHIYLNGEGVGVNYFEAIFWQKKYIAHYEKFQQHIDVIRELVVLGDICETVGDEKNAFESYHKMIDVAKATVTNKNMYEYIRLLMISFGKLGKIHLENEQFHAAKSMFKEAQVLCEQWVKNEEDEYAFLDLSLCYINIGDVYYETKKYELTEKYYCKAWKCIIEQVGENVNDAIQDVLCHAKYKIATIKWKLGEKNEAYNCYLDAISLASHLSKETKNVEDNRRLCALYNIYASKLQDDGDFVHAEFYYKLALRLSKKLYERYKDRIDVCSDCACSYVKLAGLRLQKGEKAEAIKLFQEGIQIDILLSQKTKKYIVLNRLATQYEEISEIFIQHNEIHEAEEYLKKAIKVREGVLDRIDSEKNQSDLCSDYGKLANLLSKKTSITYSEFEEINELYQKTLNISRKLFHKSSDILELNNYHATLIRLGDINEAYSESLLKIQYIYEENSSTVVYPDEIKSKELRKLCENYYLQSIEILEGIQVNDSIDLKRLRVVSYNRCANFYENEEKNKAKIYGMQAIELSTQISEETKEIADYKSQYICIYRYGEICSDSLEKYTDESLEYFSKALQCAKVIHRMDETIDNYKELANSYKRIGLIQFLKEDMQEALKFFMLAMEVFQNISKNNTDEVKYDLAQCYKYIGTIYFAMKNKEKGKKYLRKMLAIENPGQEFCLDYL